MLNAVFLIRERILEDQESKFKERCNSIRTNEKLGLTINPYPINREDVLDFNGEIEDEFEDSLHGHKKLTERIVRGSREFLQTAYCT